MKKIETKKWTIGENEDSWRNEDFSSRESAIKNGKNKFEKENFYIGQLWELKFENNEIDVEEEVINQLFDSLDFYCSEEAECWYEGITEEQKEDLNKMIGKTVFEWIEKYKLHPSFDMVDDIELITEDTE